MIVGKGVNNWLHTKRAMKPPKRALRFAPVREVGKVRQVRQVRHSATFPIQGARSEGGCTGAAYSSPPHLRN